MKHTKGPWSYHSYKAAGKHFGIETADHAHGIAGISPNVNASTLLTMEEHEANAQLIAAAPDLLLACQTWLLIAYAKNLGNRDILVNAISKAEGQTNG